MIDTYLSGDEMIACVFHYLKKVIKVLGTTLATSEQVKNAHLGDEKLGDIYVRVGQLLSIAGSVRHLFK